MCYVCSVLLNAHSGTERHLLRLVRALNRDRFDPLLVVLQRSPFLESHPDPKVPLEILGFRSFVRPRDWLRIWRLARLLRQRNVQIAELHSPEGQLVGTLAARLAGVPAIIACRRNQGYGYGWKEKLQNRLTNWSVSRFLANSQAVIDSISSLERIEPHCFELIYNGIDLEEFDREGRVGCHADFEAACQDHVVVSVAANLRAIKNLPMFLRAAQYVASQRHDVKFVVLGAGPEEQRLKRFAAELGLADRVLWLGAVIPAAPYLGRSDIACLSSESEGLSNAILDYMAASLPVVATDVGGAAEAIDQGKTGFLVPPGDFQAMGQHILQLSDDPALRRRMGRAGRNRVVEKFSLAKQMSAYEELYQRILVDRGQRGGS